MSWKHGVVASALFSGSVLLLLAACDEVPSGPRQGPDTSDQKGYLLIDVSMTGVFLSRTATATIDDTLIVPLEGFDEQQPTSAHARVLLKTGFHRVKLSGMEANCDGTLTSETYVTTYEDRGITLLARCRGAGLVTGRTMAWISEGDWGNDISLMTPDGEVVPGSQDAWGATDLAWSHSGEVLAALLDPKRVVMLDAETNRSVREWSNLVNGISIGWVPGQDAISALELFPTGCKIRVIEAPWTPTSSRLIPCGPATKDARGDLAWAPDGKTIAVGLRGDESLRFVEAATGDFHFKDIPESGLSPVALAWAPGGASLYVLTMCTPSCAPARLTLLHYNVPDGSWERIGSWNTFADFYDQATLELIGTDYIAVGPVKRSVLLVPLNGAGETRALLGEGAFRASRRP